MNRDNSLFSCLGQSGEPEKRSEGLMPTPPPATPPPGASQVAEMEAKLRKQAELAAAAERRIVELEKSLADLKRVLETRPASPPVEKIEHKKSAAELKMALQGLTGSSLVEKPGHTMSGAELKMALAALPISSLVEKAEHKKDLAELKIAIEALPISSLAEKAEVEKNTSDLKMAIEALEQSALAAKAGNEKSNTEFKMTLETLKRSLLLEKAEREKEATCQKMELDESVNSALLDKNEHKALFNALREDVEALRRAMPPADWQDIERFLKDGLLALQQRMQKFENGDNLELNRRFAGMDSAIGDVSRKAISAAEASAGNLRRLEKLEELAARTAYMENRLNAAESRGERFMELGAAVEVLRNGFQGLEKSLNEILRRVSGLSEENKKTTADGESLSRQVAHLSALFNHFRSELGFLMPKKNELSEK